MSTQQQKPASSSPFVLTFHVLKLQLLDRAPNDEGWERGFKANWAAPANRISCRLVRTVSALTETSSSSSSVTSSSSSGIVGSSTPASSSPTPLREKQSAAIQSQVLATTPPMLIDNKKLCVTMMSAPPSSSTSSSPKKNNTQQQPQQQQQEESLLVMPGMENLLTASPVILMEVCRHNSKAACAVECRTTFNLVAMSGSVIADRGGNNKNGNSNSSSSSGGGLSATASAGGGKLIPPSSSEQQQQQSTNNSNSSYSYVIDHALMAPVAPMNDSTIFVLATVALTKHSTLAHPASTSAFLSSAPVPPPPLTLENLSGSVRLSSTDLFVPSLLFNFPEPRAHLISNVLVVGNATESTQLCVKISSSCDLVRAFPAAGTVIGPRQRAFFSITFCGWNENEAASSPNSSSSSSSSAAAASGIKISSGRAALAQLSQAKIEVTVQDVSTNEAHHSVPLRLHLRKADQGHPFGCSPSSGGVHLPYQLWLNSVCVSNRSLHPVRDMPYVRSVLPVFLMRAPSEDIMAVAKEAILVNQTPQQQQQQQQAQQQVQKLQQKGSATSPSPSASSSSSTKHSNVVDEQDDESDNDQNNNNNKKSKTSNKKSKVGTIDLLSFDCDSFVMSVTIGVVRGLPGLGTFGFHCPTYKIVACPFMEDLTNVSNSSGFTEFLQFETGEVYPSVQGSLRWDVPLVFRRKKRKQQKEGNNNLNKNNNNNNNNNSTWQHSRIGLRLVEVAPEAAKPGSSNSSSATAASSSNFNQQPQPQGQQEAMQQAASSSSLGNVIAEATLVVCPPSPLNSVPSVIPQPLVFVVRPCFPRYDALRTTSWLSKGTIIHIAPG